MIDKNNIESLVFKVTCENNGGWITSYMPDYIRKHHICKLINETSLFVCTGMSLIDNNPIYRINKSAIRNIKINNKDDYFTNQIIDFLKTINSSIEIYTPL